MGSKTGNKKFKIGFLLFIYFNTPVNKYNINVNVTSALHVNNINACFTSTGTETEVKYYIYII